MSSIRKDGSRSSQHHVEHPRSLVQDVDNAVERADNAVKHADNAVKHTNISVAYEQSLVKHTDISVAYADTAVKRSDNAAKQSVRADKHLEWSVCGMDLFRSPDSRIGSGPGSVIRHYQSGGTTHSGSQKPPQAFLESRSEAQDNAAPRGNPSPSIPISAKAEFWFWMVKRPRTTGRRSRTTDSWQIFINAAGDAAGELTWYQNATDRGAFPDGIPLVAYKGVIGSRYVPEPAGLNVLGLEESIVNAQLDLSGEDVSTEPELALTVQRTSIKTLASAKVRGVKIQFNKKSGILTGSMTMPATKTSRARVVTFRGIRTPKGSGIIGHFSAPSAKKSTLRSTGMLKVSAR